MGAALLVSHLLVAEPQDKSMLVLLGQLNYWVAMVFSWPLCYGLMYWIHVCTRWLDARLPWDRGWVQRMGMQLLLGVGAVLVLDVGLVMGYFALFDNDFWGSGYMAVEFPIVRWMVLFMNALYIAWYFAALYFQQRGENELLKLELSEVSVEAEGPAVTLEARLGQKIFQLELSEVACLERRDDVGYLYLLDGRVMNTDLRMAEAEKLLSGHGFCQLNRSVLLSVALVRGYQRVRNRQAQVLLAEGLELPVSLLVSRNRLEAFLVACERFAVK